MNKLLQSLALPLLVLVAAGCGQPAKVQSLKDTKVPPGFTFQTTRGVEVNLSTSAALVPAGKTGQLTLARPDGKVVFAGYLTSKGSDRKIRVSLPNKDTQLVATLVAADGKKVIASLPVDAGRAAHRFE